MCRPVLLSRPGHEKLSIIAIHEVIRAAATKPFGFVACTPGPPYEGAPSVRLECLPGNRDMRRPSDALQAHRGRILELARAHGASNVRVFGSAARGTDREGSDVDLLVDMDGRATLFTLTGLEQALSELLGVPVDVRTPAEISRYIRDRVLSEARPL